MTFLIDYYGHIETNYIMTKLFEIKMTREEIIEGLRSNYGIEFTAADVKGFCAMNDIDTLQLPKRSKTSKSVVVSGILKSHKKQLIISNAPIVHLL